MSRLPPTWWVPVIGLLVTLTAGIWLATRPDVPAGRPGEWWGRGSAGVDLDGSRERAAEYAEQLAPGLRVGEVMRFERNVYVQLEEADGTPATEVLVDPRTGGVRLEHGPAMMWNTRYGVHPGGTGPALSAVEVATIARGWAGARGLGLEDPVAFPGYYTLHTVRDGRVEGMLSVHAVTGAVWYHSWHGRLLEVSGHG